MCCSWQSGDTVFLDDWNVMSWHFAGWQNMCHDGSCRPSKFPFGLLTHENINSLQFIVHKDTFVCVCVHVRWRFFSANRWEHWFLQRKSLWKWVTLLPGPLIGWNYWDCLSQFPVSVNGEALRTNGRAVVRMQQWSRKKQPIVPGTSEKCDLPTTGSGCST